MSWVNISFLGPMGLPRVMLHRGGVSVVGAGHGVWGASDDYSMPTFAPELAKHDPFGHARAMIGVQGTLLAPVQVLPHGHSSKTRRHDPRWPANEGAFERYCCTTRSS